MLVHYISNAMDPADFAALFKDSTAIPGQQGPKFNRLLMEGLAANGVSVRACTGRPVSPSNCPRKFLPGFLHKVSENLTYHYGSIPNLPVVKNLWQMVWAYLTVLFGKGDGVVCDVLNASISLGAIFAAKQRKIPCVAVVTDLPELMVTATSPRHVALVEKCIRNCTAYVFLTEPLNRRLNSQGKPYVIIEGICDSRMEAVHTPPARNREEKQCMYAGLLDARYGVKMMVEGFLLADLPDARLHIYGSGPYAEELEQVAATHDKILYHGTVMNEEVIRAELDSDLLLNPRPTHEEFTHYCFPSKILEYLSSGTAMLTTRLASIPEEYFPHVYLAEEETPEGMARTLRQVLSLPEQSLREKGDRGREFVLTHKNNIAQSRKLLDLLK